MPERDALDTNTHRRECLERRATVLAFQESLDFSRALRDGAQHRRAMRDGLVSWHPDVAGDAGAWARYESCDGGAHNPAANAPAKAASRRSFCAAVPVVMRK